jgi:hypothetical protein
MAKRKQIKKTKFLFLRRIGAGLLITCFTVFVCGQAVQGVSASTILFESSLLILGIGLSMQMVLKIWSSYEEIQDKPMIKKSK